METDVTPPCAGVLAPPPRESVRSRLWVEKPNLSDGLRREGSLLVLATLVIGLSFAINALNSRGFWVSIPCLFNKICLLYTSDAADDLLCVDLGGRRIITK